MWGKRRGSYRMICGTQNLMPVGNFLVEGCVRLDWSSELVYSRFDWTGLHT